MNTFPDNPMILIKLQDRLMKETDLNSVMGWSIFQACLQNKTKEAIEMIKQQSMDNAVGMAKIIGEPLLKDILNYQS